MGGGGKILRRQNRKKTGYKKEIVEMIVNNAAKGRINREIEVWMEE
jgi:hypothetical protein